MKKFIVLVGVFFTHNASAYVLHHSSDPEHLLGIALGCVLVMCIASIIGFLLRQLITQTVNGSRYAKKEIKEIAKRHKNNQEKYRKYLKSCDKAGKPPLSYKQWKFVYVEETAKKSPRKTTNTVKKRQISKK